MMIRTISCLSFPIMYFFSRNSSMTFEGNLCHGTEYVSWDGESAVSGGVEGS